MRAVAVLLVLALAGCYKVDTPHFTEGDDTSIDASTIDADTTECTAADPAIESSECPADQPICDASATCRPCTRNYECESGACYLIAVDSDPVGQCVPEANVVYIDAAAPAGNTECTRAAPCREIGMAPFDSPLRRHVVVLPGTYQENLQFRGVSGAEGRFLIGYGAEVRPMNTSGDALMFTSPGTYGVYGLSIFTAGRGMVVADTHVVIAEDVLVEGNVEVGVIVSNGGRLAMSRSRLLGNLGGGLWVVGGRLALTNSFVRDNGGTGGLADIGGVLLENPTVVDLAFNTITENGCSTTTCDAPGVECAGCLAATGSDGGPVRFHSNIISDNFGSTTAGRQVNVVSSAPIYESCLVNPPLADGINNVTGDPGFEVDGFHLAATSSPAVNQARIQVAGPTAVLEDIDGQPRPLDKADIGADECVPDTTGTLCE